MPEPIDLDVARQRRRLADAIRNIHCQWDLLTAAGCAEELLAIYRGQLAELEAERR
jgi:hypothetical protein